MGSLYPDFEFKSPWPAGYSKWALVSSAGSMSEPHVDAAGFCTFVQVQFGVKVWYIAEDLVDGGGEDLGQKIGRIPLLNKGDIDASAYRWTRIVLGRSDCLCAPRL